MQVEVTQLPWKAEETSQSNDVVIRDAVGFEVCRGWHFLRAEHGSRIAVLEQSGAMYNQLFRCLEQLDPEMSHVAIVNLREEVVKLLNTVRATATKFARA